MQSLGATAFDYHDPDIVERILEVLREGDVVFDVISSSETQKACGEILRRIGGGKLLTTSPAPQVGIPEGIEGVFGMCLEDTEVWVAGFANGGYSQWVGAWID